MNNQVISDFVYKLRETFSTNGLIAEVVSRKDVLVLTWEVSNMEKELIYCRKLITELAHKNGFEARFANPGPASLNAITGKYEKEFVVRPITE